MNDRLGFHHVMMSVGLWPILLSTASEVKIDDCNGKDDIDNTKKI